MATIRADTTAIETNIHWPTDASLLWDTWRVFSIFEPHTELLKRGRRQKPTEFGHMVLLCQSPEKFITDYEAYEHRQADCRLTEAVIERHEGLFGERKIALHWVVRAWRQDGTGYTIDYGVQEVRGTTQGTDEGVDEAIQRALSERRQAIEDTPYCTQDGEHRAVDLTLIDAGWRTEAIYGWCLEAGQQKWKPAMGFGKSAGCTSAAFYEPTRTERDKKMGQRWFLSKRPRGIWLVCTDADHWKAWEHDHWLRDPAKPGALFLFGHRDEEYPDRMSADQKGHFSYSKHLTAEVETEELVRGSMKRYWKSKRDTNHYFDASYMTDVAATMMGVPLLGKPRPVAGATVNDWIAARSRAPRRW